MRKKIYWIWLLALLLFPFILWFLPADSFDGTGRVMCLSRLLFDVECIGCGITRAIMHFHHLQFEDAIYYNFGVVLVYPFLIWLWCRWIRNAAKIVGVLKK